MQFKSAFKNKTTFYAIQINIKNIHCINCSFLCELILQVLKNLSSNYGKMKINEEKSQKGSFLKNNADSKSFYEY